MADTIPGESAADAASGIGADGSDDVKARRNALLLAAAQALAGANIVVHSTLGPIGGAYLADNKLLSTLPMSMMIVGIACSTLPASLLMAQIGRRAGFILGVLSGMIGAGVAAWAIWLSHFALFCLGGLLIGVSHAFVQYYRFAAADTASASFRPKAISWVLAGGVAAAFFGPQLIIWFKDLFAPVQFAGAYAMLAVLGVAAIAVLAFIDVPNPRTQIHAQPARPLREILQNRQLLVAVAAGMVSYSTMNLVMTATPLAMLHWDHGVDDAAFVIQWHVVAMFAPSFFTGHLIARFGSENMIAFGMALMIGCAAAALTGIDLYHFSIALVLLGLGWNFSFIAATAMVAASHRPSERGKVQGLNDLCVFSTMAVASFASGALFHHFGWHVLQWVLVAASVMALVLIVGWRVVQGTPPRPPRPA